MPYLILFFSVVNFLLGLVILLQTRRDKVNIAFLIFALSASIWTFNNFYLRFNPVVESLRVSYSLGIIVATLALIWVSLFLKKRLSFFTALVLPVVSLIVAAVTINSNLVINKLDTVTGLGYEGELGSLFQGYSLYISFLIFFVIFILLKSFNKETDPIRRSQIGYVLTGISFFALVSLTVSFIVPVFFNTLSFTVLDNFSFSIFLAAIVYAILKHHLFNLKVIATELLTFSLWIFLLIRSLLSQNTQEQIINGVLFAVTVVLGLLLIRSVLREVDQREKIEKLAKDLEIANRQQESLIHFISHEVKGYLTKGSWTFNELLEGVYGPVPDEMKNMAELALKDVKDGVGMVEGILHAANLKKGTVEYSKKPFDLKAVVIDAVSQLKPTITAKGLVLETNIDETANFTLHGDGEQIGKHVIRNLVDNAIKYSPTGKITISLTKQAGGKVLFSVKDTGVGITEEDKAHLFTEGGKGKESTKVNVHSTGYGLFIAKVIVEAHHGRIWAESEGSGKGSTFFVELVV